MAFVSGPLLLVSAIVFCSAVIQLYLLRSEGWMMKWHVSWKIVSYVAPALLWIAAQLLSVSAISLWEQQPNAGDELFQWQLSSVGVQILITIFYGVRLRDARRQNQPVHQEPRL